MGSAWLWIKNFCTKTAKFLPHRGKLKNKNKARTAKRWSRPNRKWWDGVKTCFILIFWFCLFSGYWRTQLIATVPVSFVKTYNKSHEQAIQICLEIIIYARGHGRERQKKMQLLVTFGCLLTSAFYISWNINFTCMYTNLNSKMKLTKCLNNTLKHNDYKLLTVPAISKAFFLA